MVRRRWLPDDAFADLVALCQFLPGPASSQLGLAIGWKRCGWKGAAAAWAGFTLPSAALMVALAYGVRAAGVLSGAGCVEGLKIAAAAVVAQAVTTMARRLCPDVFRATIALGAAAAVTVFRPFWMQPMVIAAGAAAGLLGRQWMSVGPGPPVAPARGRGHRAWLLAVLYGSLLFILPAVAHVRAGSGIGLFAGLYRAGALVFGGGHVVLPLLQHATVDQGWIAQDTFLAGYGGAQALPGPLFAFAAFLGAIIAPGGIPGAMLALAALYLPGVLVLFAALPSWERLRGFSRARLLLAGANAAVVGLLGAALYSPLWTSTITAPSRFALALAAFGALRFWRAPAWGVVLICAGVGALCFNRPG